jgi:hypothetical protein
MPSIQPTLVGRVSVFTYFMYFGGPPQIFVGQFKRKNKFLGDSCMIGCILKFAQPLKYMGQTLSARPPHYWARIQPTGRFCFAVRVATLVFVIYSRMIMASLL